MSNDKLGMIAFGKVNAVEKRIKLIEEYLKEHSSDIKSQTSSEEVRNNNGAV